MSATTTQEILRQEETLAEAKRTLDLDALNCIYDDQLLMTGVLGEPTCTKGAIIDEAKRTFKEELGGVVFKSMLPPDQKPPLELNRIMMEKFRPAMRRSPDR